jgi:hypothetical protein
MGLNRRILWQAHLEIPIPSPYYQFVVQLLDRSPIMRGDHGFDGFHDHVHDWGTQSDASDRSRIADFTKVDN